MWLALKYLQSVFLVSSHSPSTKMQARCLQKQPGAQQQLPPAWSHSASKATPACRRTHAHTHTGTCLTRHMHMHMQKYAYAFSGVGRLWQCRPGRRRGRRTVNRHTVAPVCLDWPGKPALAPHPTTSPHTDKSVT